MSAQIAVTAQEIQAVLLQTPFAKIYNIALASLDDGECALRIPFSKATERPGGIVAGPVYMAAADVAMWFAIMTKLGANAPTVTTELNSTFLSSARQEEIVAKARVLKLGKNQIFGVAECRTLDGKLLTHHTLTYVKVTPAP